MPKRQQVFFLNCIHLIWLHLYRSLLFWQTPKNSVNFLYLVLWLCGRKWQRGTQKSTKVISVIWFDFFTRADVNARHCGISLKKIYWNVKDTVAWTGSQMGVEDFPWNFKKQMTQTKIHPTHRIKKRFFSSRTKSLVRDYESQERERGKNHQHSAKKRREKEGNSRRRTVISPELQQ